jgi:SSS family solute:Na+ symporter
MIGYALHKKGIITIPTKEFNGQVSLDGDKIFPLMVMNLLPAGIRGLVVGGLLAALMSSLSSLFNSCASLFTIDIYEKIRPGKSEKHLVTVGRIATGVIVIFGIMWIPVMPMVSQGGLYKYLQSVQGYLAPPITVVFLLGLFWKRINSYGAVWGLCTGFVLGMGKLTVQAFFGAGKIETPNYLAAIGDFNFLYYSGVLFAISVLVVVFVSLVTAPPGAEKVASLTFATATEEDKCNNRASWNTWDVIATCVVLGLVLGMYLYFTFWLS